MLGIGSCVKDGENREYVLDEIIGQGGFGYVFKSHRKNDSYVFAIKSMLPSFNDKSTETAFNNEIQSAIKVKGDNIIKYEFVHDGSEFPELPPYIIMEYANNGTLNNFINEKKLSDKKFELAELIDMFLQLANGMREINKTLVHRDIKPDNILLCDNMMKITDFGLSKLASENTRTKTFKGGGTPLYMSPEAWDYSKNTIQMDIYSMGIIFYELATLCYPYYPVPKTFEECKETHLYSPIVRLESKNSSLPSSLVSVINRMLEKSTKKRFANWDEIISLLQMQNQSSTSNIDKLVSLAVAAKNSEDMARQQKETAELQAKKEKLDFCKLVYSQYENTVISPIVEFIERVNSSYAGKDKIEYPQKMYTDFAKSRFFWKAIFPPDKSLTINTEIIFEENHTRKRYINNYFEGSRTISEHYIPQYKNKNILAWCEIKNNSGYGYNLILIESDDIYGDWFIMNNKNNFSHMTNMRRIEPFAFDLNELPNEISKVQVTHLYSADFEPFETDTFLQKIKLLAFDLH